MAAYMAMITEPKYRGKTADPLGGTTEEAQKVSHANGEKFGTGATLEPIAAPVARVAAASVSQDGDADAAAVNTPYTLVDPTPRNTTPAPKVALSGGPKYTAPTAAL